MKTRQAKDRADGAVDKAAVREPRGPQGKKRGNSEEKEMFLPPSRFRSLSPLERRVVFSSTSDEEPFPFHPRLAKEDGQLWSTRGKGRTENPRRTRLASGKYTARSTCTNQIPCSSPPENIDQNRPAPLLRGSEFRGKRRLEPSIVRSEKGWERRMGRGVMLFDVGQVFKTRTPWRDARSALDARPFGGRGRGSCAGGRKQISSRT